MQRAVFSSSPRLHAHNKRTVSPPLVLALAAQFVVIVHLCILLYRSSDHGQPRPSRLLHGTLDGGDTSGCSSSSKLRALHSQAAEEPETAGASNAAARCRAAAALFYFKEEDYLMPDGAKRRPFSADALVDGKLFVAVHEAATIKEAVRVVTETMTPVVVRALTASKEFGGLDGQGLARLMLGKDQLVHAFCQNTFEVGLNMPISDVAKRYMANQSVYINDSPFDLVTLPPLLQQLNAYAMERAAMQQSQAKGTKNVRPCSQAMCAAPMLNAAKLYTELHLDPPARGAGWQYLAEGDKNWLFVSPLYINQLRTSWFQRQWWTVTSVRDPSMEELAALAAKHHHEKGPIWIAHTRPGDVVMFPPGFMHRVYSETRSIGLINFLNTPKETFTFLQRVQVALEEEAAEMGHSFKPLQKPPSGAQSAGDAANSANTEEAVPDDDLVENEDE